jgi:hypothetical protein
MRAHVVPLGLLIGCSGSSTPDSGSLTPDEACAAIASVRCAKRQTCEPGTLTAQYGDVTTCVARDKANCVSSFSAPGSGNTPAATKACADAYPSWSCPDWYNNVIPDACKTPAGTKPMGNPCLFSSQCQSAFCGIATGATCGSCASIPTVGTSCAAGVSCGGNGLYCEPNSLTCQKLVTSPGYACDAGSCGYLLGCVVALDAGSGTCQPLGLLDAGCDGQQHAAPTCAGALSYTCIFRYCVYDLYAGAGQMCGTNRDAGTYTRCAAGGSCQGSAGAQTCVAAAAEGFDCDTSLGIDCLAPARCVSTNGMATDGGPVLGKCTLSSGMTCN